MARLRHVLALPFPSHGHATPLLKLAQWIAEHGVKVTFVNMGTIHDMLLAARPELFEDQSKLRLVALPDVMEDHPDADKSAVRYGTAMSPRLQELIEKINGPGGDGEKIGCVISDVMVGWALEVAETLGIEAVGFWPFSASALLLLLHIPKLIEDGVIDEDGIPLQNVTVKVADKISSWNSNSLLWTKRNDPTLQRKIFEFMKTLTEYPKHTNIFLCNSFEGLEPSALEMVPGVLPVGPLLAANISEGHHAGSLLAEDSTCLDWLGEQGDKSVVYVALGSFAALTKRQFEELAAGLEETSRPFLWVVWPDHLVDGSPAELPDKFLDRVQDRAKIVTWAPQERVLAHKSTACFLSHCGWNSTVEGISNGVPFVCLPYFVDNYLNCEYIRDVWKVGVELEVDEDGVATRHEVRDKILGVLGSDEIRKNSMKLEEMARESVSKEGSSMKNLLDFMENK